MSPFLTNKVYWNMKIVMTKRRIMKNIKKNILLIFLLPEKNQVNEKSESLLNCIKSHAKNSDTLFKSMLLIKRKELKTILKMMIFLKKAQRKFTQMYLTNYFLNLG